MKPARDQFLGQQAAKINELRAQISRLTLERDAALQRLAEAVEALRKATDGGQR